MARSLALLLRDRERLHAQLPDFIARRDLAEDSGIQRRRRVWNEMLACNDPGRRAGGGCLDMNCCTVRLLVLLRCGQYAPARAFDG
jgi:hypothetical protein